MLKKIDLEEAGISFSRLLRITFKNSIIMIFSVIVALGLALVYISSPLMDRGTFKSSGSVRYQTVTSATVLDLVTDIAKSVNVSELAANALAREPTPVKLQNGTLVTPEIIRRTLTAVTTPNALRITISFSHPEEAIVVPVINAVIDATIADGNANYPLIGNNLRLGEYATTSSFDGISPGLYLAIASLIGLLIGGTVGVLWDAFKGTLYSARDLKELSISSFLFNLNTTVPVSKDALLSQVGLRNTATIEMAQAKALLQTNIHQPVLTTILNNIESTRPNPNESITTLITSPLPLKAAPKFVIAYGLESARQGRKTLVIDFDLMVTPLTSYLQKHHVSLKKKTLKKTDSPFQSLKPNLDIFLPEKNYIPATVIRDTETVKLIEHVKKTYDHIIILGPSLLPDASVMSLIGYVNSAILIGRAEETTTNQMIRAYNLLIDANISTIETVVFEENIKTTYQHVRAWIANKINPPNANSNKK
jgi:Mrp family chromosome partitioning ATPase